MHRLLAIVSVLALVVSACGDDDADAPEDLSGICPPAGTTELDPFDALATGSAAEVEESLTSVSELYDTLLDRVPDDAEYPAAVLAATTTVAPTVPADEGDDGSEDGEEEPDPPTPHDDLELVIDVFADVRAALARHDYDVGAAEEDLRAVPAFAESDRLSEVVVAFGRLRQLIQRVCAPSATPVTTTTTAPG